MTSTVPVAVLLSSDPSLATKLTVRVPAVSLLEALKVTESSTLLVMCERVAAGEREHARDCAVALADAGAGGGGSQGVARMRSPR